MKIDYLYNMFRLFEFFIEAVFWLLLFLSPVLLFGAIALAVHINNTENAVAATVLIITGAIAGIIFAEYIRRKHGCSTYLSKIFSTPDIKDDQDLSDSSSVSKK
ncbi:MAG TPA: hypothetical protein VEC12_15650 [Bacteroidia bacterium]|nr:hypothetical protein [Bacteroidia bacterium]